MKKRRLLLVLAVLMVIVGGIVGWNILDNRSQAPVIESISNGSNGVNIVWKRSAGAKLYTLYRKRDNKYELISRFSGDETSYCDENVKSGNTYTYSLKIKHRIGESAEASASIDYLECPVLKKVANQVSCVYLRWTKCDGADEYTVYKKTGKGNYSLAATVTDNYYIDMQTKSGAKVIYYVVAANENIKSHISEKKVNVFINAPKINNIKNADGYVKLRWNPVNESSGYYVYRKTDDGKSDWEKIGKTDASQTNFNDKNAPKYKSCLYTVRAYDSESVSGYYSSGARNAYVSPVSVKSSVYSSGNIYIKWNKERKCTGYRIYRKIGNGKLTYVASLGKDADSYAEKRKEKGKRYEYAVCACYGSFVSEKTYTGSISFVNKKKPMLALSFDDGPNDEVTKDILGTLKKYDARATFFVVGERAQWTSSEECISKAYGIGCEIGNHTYGHQNLTYSSADIHDELTKTSDIVRKITGNGTGIMRPPEGAYNSNVSSQCPYPMIIWSVDTRDWESRNSASVFREIKSGAEDGAIILMHDLYPTTAEAVKNAVPWLVKKGYQLVTVSELLEAKGIKMKAGEAYYSG